MQGKRQTSSFKKILVGYDGSSQAGKALDAALAMGKYLDAKVLVLTVARPAEPSSSAGTQNVLSDARELYDKALQKIRENALYNEIDTETEVVAGHPAEQIILKAEQAGFDLIVVGRRGVSDLHEVFVGSVSEQVLQHAPCPVMVVH